MREEGVRMYEGLASKFTSEYYCRKELNIVYRLSKC